MTGRIAIAAAAFVAGLAIASLPSTSSATICREIVSLGIDRCKCPIDEIQHLDLHRCPQLLEERISHEIPDYERILKQFVK
ncbi:MAG: hypothetical protein OXP75_13075 [Rhodospirillales bacterium]|nr:hypothetical protein [Rhodospirillales bacterium]